MRILIIIIIIKQITQIKNKSHDIWYCQHNQTLRKKKEFNAYIYILDIK